MGDTYAFGLYEGEPTGVEILQRKAFRDMHGPNHLAISHKCPACGRSNTEWVRNEWSICYDCELAFEGLEEYIVPLPEWLEYEESLEVTENDE